MSEIRLADVADKLGVSISTVSRAIQSKGSARVSAQYREIQRIAREMGYKRGDKSTNKREINRIALINVDIGYMNGRGEIIVNLGYTIEGLFGRLVLGLQHALSNYNCELNIFSVEKSPITISKILDIVQQTNVDGIILNVNGDLDGVSELTTIYPVVQVNASIGTTGVDSVVSDDFGGMILVVKRLMELGHRRIAFWMDKPSTSHHVQRLYGYRAAMEASGIDYERIYCDDLSMPRPFPERMMAGFQEYLNESEKPTAIISACDSFGWFILQLANHYGVKVPEELSVFSFDNLDVSTHTFPSLSSVDARLDLMAEEAVDLLIRRRVNPDAPFRRVVLQANLVERASSGLCKE